MIFFICTALFVGILYSFYSKDLRNKNSNDELSDEDKLLHKNSSRYVTNTVAILVGILLISPLVVVVPSDDVIVSGYYKFDAYSNVMVIPGIGIALGGFFGPLIGVISWWWFFILFPLHVLSKIKKNISFAWRSSLFLFVCLAQSVYIFKTGTASFLLTTVIDGPLSGGNEYSVHHWLSGMYIYVLLLLYIVVTVWLYFSMDGDIVSKNKKVLRVSCASIFVAVVITTILNPIFSKNAVDEKSILKEVRDKYQRSVDEKRRETEERIIRGYNETPDEKMRRALETMGSSTVR